MESVESKMKCYTALSNVEITTNYSVESGNQITHQVGDTSITTKGDSVIIKAGGIEVVIDSNGLVVKGGEIKTE
ncbi:MULTISPECIES: hypothetical protein [Helicobacter]|uniref:VgrG protein n=1 Tax=Helicobacter bilis ATCC 43879 TaxID=613026 RepID=T5LPK4_9HELI|nr:MULTISPECIES: hypothetical protein [Helicobacter]EQM94582.1 hypothetical protein HRAG_02368 [Helicobacter bilis ATCC 43879]